MSEAVRTDGAPPWVPAPPSAEPDRVTELAERILANCRGEGPANCVARCPLHVDARGYVRLTAEGRFSEALRLVRERLPFPGILGYLCDHPCELHCKRIDEDEAIRVREIKRFLAEWEPGEPQHVLDREPAREGRIAVVGAGPAGLLAAHDLTRRGYTVTVYERERRIGGSLTHKVPSWRIPRRVVDRDLSIIPSLGIEVRGGVALGREVTLEDLRACHDAVILSIGFEGGTRLLRGGERFLRRTPRETLGADPFTCEVGPEGLFAGGQVVSGPISLIHALAQGRRAAESAHRYLDGGDLRENREDPAPVPLLWKLEIDEEERRRRERTPLMLRPYGPAMTESDARREAQRCLDCSCRLCVDECEFLRKHCGSPKELARRVRVDRGDEETLEVIYSCNLCSLCATLCPADLDTGEMLLEARREAVRKGRGPTARHRGALATYRAGVSGTFTLLMSEPGRSRSKRLFFPGCSPPAQARTGILEIYDRLRRYYPGTGVMMHCCGAPVEQLGMEEMHRENLARIRSGMDRVGAQELITVCPDCTETLSRGLPEARVVSVWELLAKVWKPPRRHEGISVTLHDPCKARNHPGSRGAVRRLLKAGGCSIEELPLTEDRTRCCGSGGVIRAVDPDLALRVARRRGDESSLPMVTYCAGCRAALRDAGTESIHLLDFLLASDWRAALRSPPPGRVARYANRLMTKRAFRRLSPFGAE